MGGNSADSDKSVTQHPHPPGPDLDLGNVKMEDLPTAAVSYDPSHALTAGHFEQRIAQHDQSIKAYLRQELSGLLLMGPKTNSMDMLLTLFPWSKGNLDQGRQYGLLDSEIKKLSDEYHKLLEQNQQLIRGNEVVLKERDDAILQVNKLMAEKAQLTENLSNLRQILVPTSDNHINDSEITQKFTKLRSQINTLVRQTWKIEVDRGMYHAHPEATKFFHGLLRGNAVLWKCPHERLRFAVFSLLNNIIFRCRSYFLTDSCVELDEVLRDAEEQMWHSRPPGDIHSLIEWRNATMKATGPLRTTGKALSVAAQRRIWGFFQVLKLQSPNAGEAGLQRLQKVCDQAVELSMMMRQAKDDIYVYFSEEPNEEPLSEWDRLIEEGSSAKSSLRRPGHISYIYSGALVKTTKENPEKLVVLEKAEAVVYDG